jgi:starch-binding outer membrane protein, SusD/RagB family
MTSYRILGRRSLGRTAGAMALALSLTACQEANDRLLGVTDPDIIAPGDLEKADGAIALANGTIGTFRSTTGGGENVWLFGGLLADEWSTSSTFIQNDETDQRRIQLINSSVTGMLRDLYRTRTRGYEAIEALKKYSPNSRALIAEMYLARGFSEMQLALNFCNGIPIPNNPLANPPENGFPRYRAHVRQRDGCPECPDESVHPSRPGPCGHGTR